MPATADFGTIITASEVEEAIILLLKRWFPTYLREVERQTHSPVGVLVPPRVYTNRNDFETIEGENMPLCVVVSPGLVDEPFSREAGIYIARWSIGVGIAIAAETEAKANRMVKIYAATARAIVLQNQDIGGLAIRVDWLNENYDDLPDLDNQLQQYRSAGVYFAVEVDNAINKYLGPRQPDQDPYTSFGQVQDVIIDVGRMEEPT